MSVRLTEGGIYRDRKGYKVGPLLYDPKKLAMPFYIKTGMKSRLTYGHAGNYKSDGAESDMDLVALWDEPPPEKPVPKHDEMSPERWRAAIAKTWDSYKLLP